MPKTSYQKRKLKPFHRKIKKPSHKSSSYKYDAKKELEHAIDVTVIRLNGPTFYGKDTKSIARDAVNRYVEIKTKEGKNPPTDANGWSQGDHQVKKEFQSQYGDWPGDLLYEQVYVATGRIRIHFSGDKLNGPPRLS